MNTNLTPGFQGTHVAEKQLHSKDHSLKIAESLNLLSTLFHRLILAARARCDYRTMWGQQDSD